MKMHFKEKKVRNFRKSVCVHNSPTKLLFQTKIGALLVLFGAFHKNSPSVVCCSTFGKFEIRTLTLNRFKNQSSDTLKLLGSN